MNKLLIIAIVIALIAMVANAKSLICAQCQTEKCLTANNCHLARSGLLGSTLEEDEEQAWKGWKKIGNVAKKIVQTVPIAIALDEEEAAEVAEQKWKGWRKLEKIAKGIVTQIPIAIALEEEIENETDMEQKWKGWRKLEKIAKGIVTQIPIAIALDEEVDTEGAEQRWKGWKKIGNVAKGIVSQIPITIALDEEEEVEGAEQRWKGWKKIGNALKDLNVSVALDEDEVAEEGWKGWKKIGNALKNLNVSVALDEDEVAEEGWKGWKKIGNALKNLNVSVALDEEEEEYGFQGAGDNIVSVAKSHLGVKYVYGGSSWATGVDCSAFTQLVVKEATGISLPRTSSAQRGVGSTVNGVANARPGDLVFFPGHVGIYVGNNQIAHAPSSGSVTKVANIWQTPELIKRIV